MTPSPEVAPGGGSPGPDPIRRFTAAERWVHRCLAAVMGVLIITAALLYVGPLSALVGRRDLVSSLHYWSGLLLPLPLLVGYFASAALRDDVARLNRFLPGDWAWLRARALGRRAGEVPAGKFNAGQKLNSAFVLGAVIVMFLTGLGLHFFDVFPDSIRTGITFVHDVLAAAVVVVAGGHLWMAMRDPAARAGLRTGLVPRRWAEREHALWAAETAHRQEGSGAGADSPT
jgi:formate dehydrogenase subunit gamma